MREEKNTIELGVWGEGGVSNISERATVEPRGLSPAKIENRLTKRYSFTRSYKKNEVRSIWIWIRVERTWKRSGIIKKQK